MTEEKNKDTRVISRRKFLKDASIVVGSTAVSSAFFLSACGKEVEVTKTVTTTIPGGTKTITTTAADNTVTVTKYTCPVCSQEFSSLEELKKHFDTNHGEVSQASDLNVIKFTLDGSEIKVEVDPGWDLNHLLHDRLGVIGVKNMCGGYGACGACSVIIDGKAVLSCMTLAIDCDGKTIETSEGIAYSKHPIFDAFIMGECMQCGYCTPGFMVTAKALLDKNPNPSKTEIEAALEGNLCRCHIYPTLVPAVQAAAKNLGGAK